MNAVLDYDHLYRVCEELQQLVGSQLQGVYLLTDSTYVLDFRLPGESRWLVVDITPARPFIVSISSTKSKGIAQKTPALNFLRAHFINKRLNTIEIAQKPNRTVKFTFGKVEAENEAGATFIVKCFPHGQHLILDIGTKSVNFPWRPRNSQGTFDDETVSYVEPEKTLGWQANEKVADEFVKAPKAREGAASDAYQSKIIKKIEKAIHSIDTAKSASEESDGKKIDELYTEADALKVSGHGDKVEALFEEIKKLKRKRDLNAERRAELVEQLEKVRAQPVIEMPVRRVSAAKKAADPENQFSGTRVVLDPQFELWVGRTAWQNDDLVRLASPHELWIHLRDYPGAHGIIRGPKKKEVPPALVDLSCRIVAILSQSKKRPFTDGDKLDFIVTPRKYVKKQKGAEAGRVIVEREQVRRVAFKLVKFQTS